MNNENYEPVTYEEAHSIIQNMNLINDFMFNYVMENEERAKEVAAIIISTLIGRDIDVDTVTSQKVFMGVDKDRHGIRLDALVNTDGTAKASAEVYDLEMEDRVADKKYLPRRNRFYISSVDQHLLETSMDYDKLPNYITIVILSYDPFDVGDMYYEARTILTTHPGITYDDGMKTLYFYADGKPNLPQIPGKNEHRKEVSELLKYIVTGEITENTVASIVRLDGIVRNVKAKPEVTKMYLKDLDRQRSHDRELRAEVTAEERIQAASDMVKVLKDLNLDNDSIRSKLLETGRYSSEIIDKVLGADKLVSSI